MRTLTIVQGEGEKGRAFSAHILACVEAQCWPGGKDPPNVRPAYLMLGVQEGAAGPVLANLRMGRKGALGGMKPAAYQQKEEIELLKSAGYEFVQQRHVVGARDDQAACVIQVFLPELFRIDPGYVDPERVAFCMLPRRDDLADPNLDISGAVAHMRKLGRIEKGEQYSRYYNRPTEADIIEIVPYAPLFGAYLNARTRCPLIPDLRFLVQVLASFLTRGLAHRSPCASYAERWGRASNDRSAPYREVGVTDVGLAPGLMMYADGPTVETVLAEETQAFFTA